MTHNTWTTTICLCAIGAIPLAYWIGTQNQTTTSPDSISNMSQNAIESESVKEPLALKMREITGQDTPHSGELSQNKNDTNGHGHSHDTEIIIEPQSGEVAANTSSDNAKLAGVMSLLQEGVNSGDPYNLGDLPLRFSQLLHESPELIEEIVQLFGQSPNDLDKEILHSLLVDAAMMLGNGEIEKYAVELISSGNHDHDNSLYSLTRDIGIRTSNSREKMLDKLPSISTPTQIRSVIESMVPQIVNPEEKQRVIAELSLYLDHTDPQVRGAAVKAVGTWGGQQQAYVIADGLTDSAGDVRHAAAAAAVRTGVRTESIKVSLLALMTDPNEVIDIRQQAHIALSNYALEGQEYDEFYKFNLELEKLGSHAH